MIVKGRSFIQLQNELLGKRARFISDCQLFPNFDVIGKVVKMFMQSGEIIFEVITNKQKRIKIGSNMSNLSYNLLH